MSNIGQVQFFLNYIHEILTKIEIITTKVKGRLFGNSAQSRDRDFKGNVVTLTVLGGLPTVVNFYTEQYTNQNYDNCLFIVYISLVCSGQSYCNCHKVDGSVCCCR